WEVPAAGRPARPNRERLACRLDQDRTRTAPNLNYRQYDLTPGEGDKDPSDQAPDRSSRTEDRGWWARAMVPGDTGMSSGFGVKDGPDFRVLSWVRGRRASRARSDGCCPCGRAASLRGRRM